MNNGKGEISDADLQMSVITSCIKITGETYTSNMLTNVTLRSMNSC